MVSSAQKASVGTHVLLDAWGCQAVLSNAKLEALLKAAAHRAGAKVLGSQFHDFQPGTEGGLAGRTGVILLAESHISIHTWPERNFVAVDVFMCGDCDPDLAAQVIIDGLRPVRHQRRRIERGGMDDQAT